ncbi:unnamed protein product [Rhizophagus irregularis]|nr:unnamed protein product [Rhizophagus irregularis]
MLRKKVIRIYILFVLMIIPPLSLSLYTFNAESISVSASVVRCFFCLGFLFSIFKTSCRSLTSSHKDSWRDLTARSLCEIELSSSHISFDKSYPKCLESLVKSEANMMYILRIIFSIMWNFKSTTIMGPAADKESRCNPKFPMRIPIRCAFQIPAHL